MLVGIFNVGHFAFTFTFRIFNFVNTDRLFELSGLSTAGFGLIGLIRKKNRIDQITMVS